MPIEGFFLVTREGLIFEVKGVLHPRDRTIAYVRYVPDPEGDRTAHDGRRYRKISSLVEKDRMVRTLASDYIWYDPRRGRSFQAVPHDRVTRIFDPVEGLTALKSEQEPAPVREAARVLAEDIQRTAGIADSDIGITGSLLLGVENEASDIDIVVYGESACRRVYQALTCGRIRRAKPYTGDRLRGHVSFRWDDIKYIEGAMVVVEGSKKLQGVFGEHEFFIKLVRRPEELDVCYDDITVKPVGRVSIECIIIDDRNSIFTPCEYRVSSDAIPSLSLVTSYRSRFAEQCGMKSRVEVRGDLEMVTERGTRRYAQIVMGGTSGDYMVPIGLS
ncbi:MAG: hypothetical protein QXS20_00595 [Candidatus Thorarchaeota archaeon]